MGPSSRNGSSKGGRGTGSVSNGGAKAGNSVGRGGGKSAPSTMNDRRGLTTRDGVSVAVGNQARDSFGSRLAGSAVGLATGTGLVGSYGTMAAIGANAQLASEARVTGSAQSTFGGAFAQQSGLSGLANGLSSGGSSSGTNGGGGFTGMSGSNSDGSSILSDKVRDAIAKNDNPKTESPDQTTARITREQWAHYLEQFDPVERQLIGEINSTNLVDQATASAYQQNRLAEQSFNRDLSRYGVNLNGAQASQLRRIRQLGNAANNTFSISNAHLEQRDRNLALGGDLMQIGRGVAGQGISGMADVAGMAAQRNAANAQAKAQNSAQRTQAISGAIGAAGSALLMGAGVKSALGLGALALI